MALAGQLVEEIDPELRKLTQLVIRQEHLERQENNLFKAIFENSPIGIALVDESGTFTRVNNNFAHIAGWPRHELESKTFQEITHEDDLKADLELVDLLYKRKIPSYKMSNRYIGKDGQVRRIILDVSAVWHNGMFLTFVSHIQGGTKVRRVLSGAKKRRRGGDGGQ